MLRHLQKQGFPSTTLTDFKMIADESIDEDGDLVHFAFMADAEPISWDRAIKIPAWRDAIVEEINSIEKNNT